MKKPKLNQQLIACLFVDKVFEECCVFHSPCLLLWLFLASWDSAGERRKRRKRSNSHRCILLLPVNLLAENGYRETREREEEQEEEREEERPFPLVM